MLSSSTCGGTVTRNLTYIRSVHHYIVKILSVLISEYFMEEPWLPLQLLPGRDLRVEDCQHVACYSLPPPQTVVRRHQAGLTSSLRDDFQIISENYLLARINMNTGGDWSGAGCAILKS